jgi:hypothetical protein
MVGGVLGSGEYVVMTAYQITCTYISVAENAEGRRGDAYVGFHRDPRVACDIETVSPSGSCQPPYGMLAIVTSMHLPSTGHFKICIV